ncbi:hypothetical protein SVAN01_10172 [Stagonosporopsis vannaccii]|nr:hypothetical protein SVAN01_10172 [Stagonosporopsis vannaccii]
MSVWRKKLRIDLYGMLKVVASSVHDASSAGFTAINHIFPDFSLPPGPLASLQKQHNKPKVRTTSESTRRRNPTVASYLGLGNVTKSAKYTPMTDGHSSPAQATRRRTRARSSEYRSKKSNATTEKASKQMSICDIENMTEDFRQPVIHELDGSGEGHLLASASTFSAAERDAHPIAATENITLSNSIPLQFEMCGRQSVVYDDSVGDFGQLCFDFESKTPPTNEQLCQAKPLQMTMNISEAEFGDDLADEDLFDLNADVMDSSNCPNHQLNSPITSVPVQSTGTSTRSADMTEMLDYRFNGKKPCSKTFTPPVTLTTRLLAATGNESQTPFVRPPFPKASRDRSPIIGLSSHTLLRTCCRIGEAINQSCQAVKTGSNILIELYARVLSSERDDVQQCFTFCDLFHAKPPYIQATYAAAIWKSVRLFEYDSVRLLQQGRICRCIGTMKRNGKDWTMTVLNVWEATWDDVEWVKGIFES